MKFDVDHSFLLCTVKYTSNITRWIALIVYSYRNSIKFYKAVLQRQLFAVFLPHCCRDTVANHLYACYDKIQMQY